jgi:hypothetical protein
MDRLVDPVIADLQTEHAAASRGGNVWKSGRVLILGYIAFVKVALLCGVFGTRQAWRDWDGDDHEPSPSVLVFRRGYGGVRASARIT